MEQLTQAQACSVLEYDPITGLLTWLETRGQVTAGDVVTSIRADGYIQVGLFGRRYMAHRLAWLMVTGAWPSERIDHFDGVRTNNRFTNLRISNAIANAQNQNTAHADSRYGLLGVSFIRGRKSKPFRAEIRINGAQHRLGTFATAEAAHAAYLDTKRLFHEGNTL